MSGLKRKEEEIGLVDLDKEKTGQDEGEDRQTRQRTAERELAVRMALAGIMAGGLVMILIGTYVLHIPLIAAGSVIVIEAVIAVALNNSQFWIHIAIMVLEAIIGIWFGYLLFMLLAAAYYFVLLVALKLLELGG